MNDLGVIAEMNPQMCQVLMKLKLSGRQACATSVEDPTSNTIVQTTTTTNSKIKINTTNSQEQLHA